MRRGNGRELPNWIRLLIEVGVLMVGIALGYAGLDKRLSVIETKMDSALEKQTSFITRGETQILLQGAAETHAHLQRQIDEIKGHVLQGGRK